MKLVTNTVLVITNGTFPRIHFGDDRADCSEVETATAGTVFKLQAITNNVVLLENSKHSISIDVMLFKEFFVEHEVGV
jgi:hypothetical protein